jgi:hypothetical protein
MWQYRQVLTRIFRGCKRDHGGLLALISFVVFRLYKIRQDLQGFNSSLDSGTTMLEISSLVLDYPIAVEDILCGDRSDVALALHSHPPTYYVCSSGNIVG